MSHPRKNKIYQLWYKAIIILLMLASINCDAKIEQQDTPKKIQLESLTVEEIVASEETVLKLTPLLKKLTKDMHTPIKGQPIPMMKEGMTVLQWPAAEAPKALSQPNGLWSKWSLINQEKTSSRVPYVKILKSWDDSKFGILKGRFDLKDKTIFRTRCTFEGRGKLKTRVAAVRAIQNLTWKLEDNQWFLLSWEQETLEIATLNNFLFTEVIDQAVDDAEVKKALRRSEHEEGFALGLQTGSTNYSNPKYIELPDIQSNYQYPCVSIVDLDNDGLDDLFVSSRLGKVQLLKNEGNGKLKDITRDSGLSSIKGFVNSAVFADFDNDGDQDLFLGRSLETALYFVNDSGYFRDKTIQKLGLSELFFVSSSSAADINGDGLLDLYLCTYFPTGNPPPGWFERYYPAKMRREIQSYAKDAQRFINLPGPPNIILMNRGNGKLEALNTPSPLRAFRASYQAVWSDIDQDGDADCYLCNDFAPDQFYRNDTPKGSLEPKFVEISEQIFPGGRSMGFGMGASWGDYDNDGDLDIYISNMYSKAGKRIISMSGEVDERIKVSAQGNFLYQNNDGAFKQVAGHSEGQIPIDKVGWSYGGQFADFDNDSKLDLYVPSGYYTAPKGLATEVDL